LERIGGTSRDRGPEATAQGGSHTSRPLGAGPVTDPDKPGREQNQTCRVHLGRIYGLAALPKRDWRIHLLSGVGRGPFWPKPATYC